MRLSELSLHTPAQVARVHALDEHDAIARRLGELGFVPGEAVEVRATGLFGREPLMVQVGFTRFALRRSEAARIEVIAA
ncbi:ferrous iron transport protein A [Lysobacter pythonis]|uniref:Ferrous iron transport protein A n=1 Tax=Solilutibacter pythonis TaxID=2483112 RepID=A0A3M2HTQ2_9GAMM|nr:FeoA family protein [Lysobacter pythonis]RMH90779.1 ferrous iron transport protein A [Lysobacter pythonis]